MSDAQQGSEGGLDRLARPSERARAFMLLASVFVVAGCGLAYELVMSAASSFFLGDTVFQFSVTIGLFMAALGLGAALSRRVEHDLVHVFIAVEVAVAAVGGASAGIIYLTYGWTGAVRGVTLLLPAIVGTLVGLELPLLVRILARWDTLKSTLSNALSFDYMGGLVAALLFPLLLLPRLGVVRSSLAFGVLNAAVALLAAATFRRESVRVRRLVPVAAAVLVALIAAFAGAGLLTGAVERRLAGGRVLVSFRTAHQHVLLAQRGEETRLLLDGHLQLSSLDEARYHESLAHPALGATPSRGRILVVGGGDGQLVREVLRWPDVRRVVLVDLDSELVELCRSHPRLRALNAGALDDPRVSVVAADGFAWVARATELFDRILLDLPDPRSEAVARLYSVEFFGACRARLDRDGVIATQASSPYYTPRVFWSVVASMEAAGLVVVPAHANVPSFGEWGFAFGSSVRRDYSGVDLPAGLRYLTPEVCRALFAWPPDLARPDVEPNRLDRPVVLRYHSADERRWGL